LSSYRVAVSGGGTGGHFYPALALADELKRRRKSSEILFIGTKRGIEARLLARSRYPLVTIHACGLPRRPGLRQLKAIALALAGGVEAMSCLIKYKPHVVLGTGGYVSGPVLLAAKLLRLPCVIQEQNCVPGMTNRLLCRWVDQVHIAFAESRRYFPRKDNLHLSGNPIRTSLMKGNRSAGLRKLRLSPDAFTVVFLGGSQGAHSLNMAAVEAVEILKNEKDIQFVLLTGRDDYPWVKGKMRSIGVRAAVRGFVWNMESIYHCADLAVSRAGASTISELAALGVPAVLVPYPHAAHGHQEANARAMEDKGAARVILDSELTGDRLAELIRQLLRSKGVLRGMSVNSRQYAREDAREKIAKAVEDLALKRSGDHAQSTHQR
jgi:UDP-N-acetylglucosamine--N-acetylmuramyl-(pentapeptide) pyrophosphoryl-undecaprenol N-acetylglucosamine transferase